MYNNFLAPLASLLLIVFIFIWHMYKTLKDKSLKQTCTQNIIDFCVEHYLFLFICAFFALPLFLQILYSIPLCVPRISSSAVLSFWGVALGILGGGLSIARSNRQAAIERREQCIPSFTIKSNRSVKDGRIGFIISNCKALDYFVISLCDAPQNIRLSPYDSIQVELSQREFDSFQDGQIEQMKQAKIDFDSKSEPKIISIKAFDADGRIWIVNYKYLPNGWSRTSYLLCCE